MCSVCMECRNCIKEETEAGLFGYFCDECSKNFLSEDGCCRFAQIEIIFPE